MYPSYDTGMGPRSPPSPPPPLVFVQAPPYVAQPVPMPSFAPMTPVISKPGRWSTGLCSCCEDCSNCCITCCCPCITFGQNVEILDRGTSSCVWAGVFYCILFHCCVQCFYTCTYRTKVRGLFRIPGDPCCDFFLHCFCHFCALCQEYRELKNNGFDPSIGWQANADRSSQAGTMVPPVVAPGMAR